MIEFPAMEERSGDWIWSWTSVRRGGVSRKEEDDCDMRSKSEIKDSRWRILLDLARSAGDDEDNSRDGGGVKRGWR